MLKSHSRGPALMALALVLALLCTVAAAAAAPTSCAAAMLQSRCGGRAPAECDLCAGQHQHLLRSAGCSATDVERWCSQGPPDTGTTVSVCKVELLWERITSGGHNICPGNAVPCAAGAASSRASMARAAALGFNVLRFGASGFWPPDQRLFVDGSTRPQFLQALDSVFDDAASLGIQLIPSLQWNHWAFADICNETLGGDMMRSPASCAQRSSRDFVSTVVRRYSSPQYKDVVYAWCATPDLQQLLPCLRLLLAAAARTACYRTTIAHRILLLTSYRELGNELNLLTDLDHANQTTGCAKSPALGTPQTRISADNFSTADMVAYQSTVAGWIRTAAHPEQVLISSGHAIPRPAAHHLALSYHKHQYDWTKDTEDELVEVLQVTKRSFRAIYIYK